MKTVVLRRLKRGKKKEKERVRRTETFQKLSTGEKSRTKEGKFDRGETKKQGRKLPVHSEVTEEKAL